MPTKPDPDAADGRGADETQQRPLLTVVTAGGGGAPKAAPAVPGAAPSWGGTADAPASWSALQAPAAPCGALAYVRLTPASALALPMSPADAAALLLPAARAAAPMAATGEPLLLPGGGAGGVWCLSFAGLFNGADLAALRERLGAALDALPRRVSAVARAEMAGPYTWYRPAAAPGAAPDASAAGPAASPGDLLERLLSGAPDAPRLRAAFQPVVSLQDGSVAGQEALCRGSSGAPQERPASLFGWAERLGRARELDDACVRAALAAAADPVLSVTGGRLFVNLHPASLLPTHPGNPAPAVEQGALWGGAEALRLDPARLVAEVSERQALALLGSDLSPLIRALKALRGAGFALCIDDAGGGHATLRLLAEVGPEFVKTERGLTQGIDHAPPRRALLSVLAETAGQAGARVVAKGVETADELASLVEMGVPYGQGFYLAPPTPSPAHSLPPERAEQIARAQERRRRRQSGGGMHGQPIGDLRTPLAPGDALRPDDVVGEVEARVMALADADGLPVLDAAGLPVGLLMKRALVARLAMLYGPDLLRRKLVSSLMDHDPLVAEAGTSVDQVVRRLLLRGEGRLDDHVLLLEGGACVGYVPARRLLEHMTQVQMRQARYANPLTGLPGNVPIEKEVNARLASGAPVAVLYADLDNFKPYNDRYGVAHGDEVIRALSEALLLAVEENGDGGEFVGHLGGDDFLVVTSPTAAPALAPAILRRFAERVGAFYTPEDQERGGMQGRDRYGVPTFFPFVSVSVAGVGNALHPLRDFAHVSERLGPLKSRAKALAPGHRIVLEGMDESTSASGAVATRTAASADGLRRPAG